MVLLTLGICFVIFWRWIRPVRDVIPCVYRILTTDDRQRFKLTNSYTRTCPRTNPQACTRPYSNSYPHSDPYSYAHSYAYSYSYANTNSRPYTNSYAHSYPNRNPNSLDYCLILSSITYFKHRLPSCTYACPTARLVSYQKDNTTIQTVRYHGRVRMRRREEFWQQNECRD